MSKLSSQLNKARPITVGTPATVINDGLNRKNSADFYRFPLSSTSAFSLSLSKLKANANVSLLNSVGQVITQSTRPKKQSENLSARLNADTYYLRVFLRGKVKTRYQLEAAATPVAGPPLTPPTPPTPPPTTTTQFQRLWLKQFGTPTVDRALAVVAGTQGVYLAGSTQGTLSGMRQGELDGYVAQYNSAGDWQWRTQIGTSQNDEIYDIAVDAADNLYTVGIQKLPSQIIGLFADGFLVKYSTAGQFLYAQDIGAGNRNDEIALGTAYGNGSVYVVGQVTSLGSLLTVNIDPFIAKYNPAGELISQIPVDLANQGAATGVAVDAQNNLYVTGITNAVATTDPTSFVTSLTEGDIFVTQYDRNGQSLWFTTLETNKTDIPGKISVDASGNIYLAGSTSGSLPGNINQGGIDAFVAKYNNTGSLQWVKQFGTTADDTAETLAIDTTGRIYAGGTTGGSLFGNASAGGTDAWMALFDSNGNRITSTQFGTAASDRLLDMTLDSANNLYLAGETEGNLDGSNQGSVDAWIAKYALINV